MPSDSSSDEDSTEMVCDDNSDVSDDFNIIEGDFVVVKLAGKSRFIHYIARVDILNGED